MASSKTLICTGASLMARFRIRAIHSGPNPSGPQQPELITARKFFPSLIIPLSHRAAHFHFPQHQNDVESLRKLNSEGVLYPSGLPSLLFFLPDGDNMSSSEPMLLFPKRTYQPSNIRKATMGGRRVIARRIAKGRFRV